MTMSSCRYICGPVSVRAVSGFGYESATWVSPRKRYESIDGFAHLVGYHRHLVISPQGRLVPSDKADPGDSFWHAGLYTTYEVYDADDVLVPAHLVLQDVAAYRRESREAYEIRCWKRRGWPLPPASYFRNGPLPGSRKRLRRPKDYKHIGTFGEVRAAAASSADRADEDMPIRIRGKRSPSLIGDNDWEGVWSFRGSDRSWKRHRRTQWKP